MATPPRSRPCVRATCPASAAGRRAAFPPSARSVIDTGDVVLEVLYKAIRQLKTFEPRHDGSFQTYLRTAVLNRIRDLARVHRPTAVTLDGEQPSAEPSPLERAITAEGHRPLRGGAARASGPTIAS